MRLRRQRDDQVEVEPFPDPRAPRRSSAGAWRCRCRSPPSRRPRRDRARPCARRPRRQRARCRNMLAERRRHRRAHRVLPAGEQHRLRPCARAARIARSALPVQHADQREQPARGVEIDRRSCASAAPSGVRIPRCGAPRRPMSIVSICARRRGADRRVVAFADREIVLHDPPERRERQEMRHDRRAVRVAGCRARGGCRRCEMQRIGPAVVADRREGVLLDQIVDRDRALVLQVGAAAADRASSSVTATSASGSTRRSSVIAVQADRNRAGMRVEPLGLAERDRGGRRAPRAARGRISGSRCAS